MEPFFLENTLVFIRTKKPIVYVVGDVVWCRRGNTTFIHRVIRVDGTKLFVKGDGRNKADGWIDSAHILGKAISFMRGGKTISLTTRGAQRINTLMAYISRITQARPYMLSLLQVVGSITLTRKIIRRIIT